MAGLTAPRHKELPVVKAEAYGSGYTCITVRDEDMASQSLPGQFFELKAAGKGQERRLYKPISVFGAKDSMVSFLIKNAGAGSAALCSLSANSTLRITGPLGNTFPLQAPGHVVLVSGGVGYPPLAFLKSRLQGADSITHIHGGACQNDIFPCDLACTEDGSTGMQGPVTDGLLQLMESQTVSMICSCGPLPMLKAVQGLASRYGIIHFASLEAYMACGIGVCHGCSIPYGDAGGYARVCHAGPVFDAAQIRWEEM